MHGPMSGFRTLQSGAIEVLKPTNPDSLKLGLEGREGVLEHVRDNPFDVSKLFVLQQIL